MTRHTQTFRINETSLFTLLREIKQGQILVPRFQRPFVWTDEQRLELLESIYLGFPIGSLLVWRTQKHRLRTYDRLGPARMDRPEDTSVHQYLLDGHQRMTTLFSALGAGLYDEDERRTTWLEESADGNATAWPIYFDLSATKGDNPFKLPPRRGDSDPLWLPLAYFFDVYSQGEFTDGLRKAGHDRKLVNRVLAVAELFRNYTIPITQVVTEDLDQATTIRRRIGGNSVSDVSDARREP